jgi:Tol biopolymer transport system component
MSVNDAFDVDLDRLLTDWLEADAAPRAPESLEAAFVEGVASTRQRPAWATTERWISMETRAQLGIMPRLAIILLTIALLAIGAIGGYAIGSGLVDASDGGDPTTGLTYYSPDGAIYTTDEAGEPARLTGEDEMAGTNAWSPDGTRFAYESWAGMEGPTTIMIRNADGSNPIAVSEPFEAPQGNVARPYLAWSPDGTRVLYWAPGIDVVDSGRGCGNPGTFCGQRIWSAPSDGSEPARVIGDPELDARSPLWTPDGETIIFAGSEGNGGLYGIYRMDADGANVERIGDLTGSAYAFDRHAISPDGATLAVVSGQGMYDLYLVDLATGEEVLIAGEDPDEIEPYWSPDGSLLAFTSMERNFSGAVEMMLYDVASGEVTSLGTSIWAQGWSPDGRFIVSGSDGLGTTVTLVDVTDPAAPVVTEHEDLIDAFMPSWQPRP